MAMQVPPPVLVRGTEPLCAEQAAKYFPSKKRTSIIREIKEEFRSNKVEIGGDIKD